MIPFTFESGDPGGLENEDHASKSSCEQILFEIHSGCCSDHFRL
jgi:hypothetical protein